MKFNDYQELALRTCPAKPTDFSSLRVDGTLYAPDHFAMASMGLAGEAGEACDYMKKVLFHGHKLDVQKLSKEIGDVLWYAAVLSKFAGLNLGDVAKLNIEKLKARYPEGFASDKSINRTDKD
jgi:NTP pyrophosphatase (non-canonical NTP hydrolase)